MCAVEFLEALLARRVQLGAVCSYNVVAAVGRGVEDGLVLAHECEGYGGGDAAEGARVAAYVEVVPGAGICQARLYSMVSYVDCEGGQVYQRGNLGSRLGGSKMRRSDYGDVTLPTTCDMVCCDANGGNPAPSWLLNA